MYNLLTLLIVTLFLIQGCSPHNGTDPKLEAKPIRRIQAENGIPVRVKTIELTTLEGWKSYAGDVEGADQVTVFGMLGDNIEAVNVKIGDYVEKDHVVAVYETDNPQANYRQAQLALENAEKMYNRMKAVFDEGGISRQKIDDVETNYRLALENFKATSKMINIKSAIDGQVVDVFVEAGEPLNPGDPICKIAKTAVLKTEVDVDESDIYLVRKDQEVRISWQALPEEIFSGRVDRISLSADPETRAFTVEILIDNKNKKLRPGAFVTVAIRTINKTGVIAIDNRIIERAAGQPFVYTVQNGAARQTPLTLGQPANELVEVVEGLQVGDVVVVEGQTLLSDAKKVLVVD